MQYKKKNSGRLICFYVAALVCAGLVAGCDKEQDDQIQPGVIDRSRVGYIIQDNFNVSTCSQIIDFAGLSTSLTDTISHTFLAPNNDAFAKIGVTSAPSYGYADNWFYKTMQYAILNGEYRLDQLPLTDNQPIPSVSGFNAYISRYLVNDDTVTTINGTNIQIRDVKASNGYLQVVSDVVQPEMTKNISDFLLTDTSFTLFTLALQHSGLLTLLQSEENFFTVLAPLNIVMRQLGVISERIDLTTPEGILAADPVELSTLLKYHIIEGRYFLDRLQRTAGLADDHLIATLNGEKLFIEGDAAGYNSATFTGKQNSFPVRVYIYYSSPNYNIANIPSGNGVIHGIDGILLP